MDPKQALLVLNELEKLGFTDEVFWRLHHFRDRRPETINGFRKYCEALVEREPHLRKITTTNVFMQGYRSFSTLTANGSCRPVERLFSSLWQKQLFLEYGPFNKAVSRTGHL